MLQKEQSSLESRIEDLQRATREMDVKLERAQDPKFIRLQAQERFELAGENELIFVFSDDEGNERELGL
jgi:hypothetical protein